MLSPGCGPQPWIVEKSQLVVKDICDINDHISKGESTNSCDCFHSKHYFFFFLVYELKTAFQRAKPNNSFHS